MQIEVKNSFKEALALRKQLCSKPFASSDFIAKLIEGARSIYGQSLLLRAVINSIQLLDRYLKSKNISELIPDEKFFLQVESDFENGWILNIDKPYRRTTIQAVSQDPKRVMNRYFLSRRWISRRLLIDSVYKRFQRFLSLTPDSQEMILWFEENARRIKSEEQVILNNKNQLVKQGRNVRFVPGELSSALKRSRIDTAIRFLKVVGKQGFESIKESEITKFRSHYRAKLRKNTAEADLIDLYSFFANCYLTGFLKTNPFQNCLLQRDMQKAKVDFIDAPNIKKILAIKTLNWKDPLTVRNRLICALAYDGAFRRSELVQLTTHFIDELDGGLIRIKIDSFLQKGDKPTTYLYLLFRPTAELLQRYLKEVRPKLGLQNDRLFVTKDGEPLSTASIARAVKKVSEELAIKTFYGRKPSPHDLRHSLATLNIEPYGKLSLIELQKRMRHTSIEVLMDHYVHNNPLAEREKYEEIFADGEKKNAHPPIGFEQVVGWMRTIGVSIPIRRMIEERYQEYCLLKDTKEPGDEAWLSEPETMQILSKFPIKKSAFRVFCREKNLCRAQMVKGRHRYSFNKAFVQDLATQYYPREVIMKHYNWHLRTFYRKCRDFEMVRIGKALLVRQDSLFQRRNPSRNIKYLEEVQS